MKRIIILLIPLLLILTSCGTKNKETATSELKNVTLVLDYVPNTNHTGIYVAKDEGYYEKAGLNVTIIEPGDDSNSINLVGANKAEFGISYQEDVTYAHADDKNIPVKAIGTIIQHNTSGFVALASSGIQSPKDFVGKTYAGWQSPSEEAVLKAVMNENGVDFNSLKIIGSTGEGPKSLGKNGDIQWYFEAWDNIKAQEEGIDFTYLPLRELDPRLDYYTPVIISSDKMIENDSETVKSFMSATKKGYEKAISDPKTSAQLLHKYAPEYDLSFLKKSQEYLQQKYTDNPEKWGIMEEKTWDNYTDFMVETGLIKSRIPSEKLFTNDFIK